MKTPLYFGVGSGAPPGVKQNCLKVSVILLTYQSIVFVFLGTRCSTPTHTPSYPSISLSFIKKLFQFMSTRKQIDEEISKTYFTEALT